jgi:hypothetical protein
LHVAPSGQVSVVLDPFKGKRRQSQGGRSDWVVVLEFEAPVEQGSERHFSKVRASPLYSSLSLRDILVEANIRFYYHFPSAYIPSLDFK